MEFESPPSLPHAHQQIRLGDIQASTHQWSKAIEFYSNAIKQLEVVQIHLNDNRLKEMIKAQMEQCEKTIYIFRLKDRSEQTLKAQPIERLTKITRAHSVSSINSSAKSNKHMTRHSTLNSNQDSPKRGQVTAKKKQKHDAHKIEELQVSNEALKTHLKEALEDIERLRKENNELRIQRTNKIQEDSTSKSNSLSESCCSENELEATI